MTAEGEHDLKDATEERYLDALAKGLANGAISRRRAIKLVGAALLGGVFSFLALPGVALARRRRHRCISCNELSVLPSRTCCLLQAHSATGCVVPDAACMPQPPSGYFCACSAH